MYKQVMFKLHNLDCVMTMCIFTCCQSFLLISYSLHNLQVLHQHSFWQVSGKAFKRKTLREEAIYTQCDNVHE